MADPHHGSRPTTTTTPSYASATNEITHYLNVENAKIVAFVMVVGFIAYHGIIHLKYDLFCMRLCWFEFMESEASKFIQGGDIALIKTGDDHPYYLLKLSKDPYETEGVVSDDYNHELPPLHQVVEGHYLEMHKTNNDGDIYYLDEGRTAIVSAYCVVGNCPPPETMLQKRRGRQQEMFLITHNLHQALCETVNYSDI